MSTAVPWPATIASTCRSLATIRSMTIRQSFSRRTGEATAIASGSPENPSAVGVEGPDAVVIGQRSNGRPDLVPFGEIGSIG